MGHVLCYLIQDFNPRSREGSDHIICIKRQIFEHFNPRSREGSDLAWHTLIINSIQFQSTLPRRERQQFQPKILFYFQLKSTIFQIINTILPFINLLFLVKCALFVHFFWCESPGIFMSASYSHPALAAFKRFCHNISVSSTGIPRSTPMCSTFV